MLLKSLPNTDQCFRFTQPFGDLYLTNVADCSKQKLCYFLLKTVFNSGGMKARSFYFYVVFNFTIQTHNNHYILNVSIFIDNK